MKVSLERLQQSRARFQVEVPADEALPYFERAARELSKDHPPKGFRPGNAPLPVMRSALGDAPIVERAVKALVQRTYVDILLERDDIEAVGRPEIAVETAGFGSPVKFTAEVAVLPEVHLGTYTSIRGTRRPVTVEPTEVERELEVLRRMRASYLAVPRPANVGDRVEVDIRGTIDRVPIESGPQTKQPLLLGESQLVPGFEEQLVGMKEGETKTFSVPFPETHHQAHLRGKTVEFAVTMRTIQQRVLPALDDHFAQGLGKFQGLQDLRQTLTDNLRAEKEERERQRYQQELLDQVVRGCRFGDLPEVLIERELDTMVDELKGGVAEMGMDFGAYLQQVRKKPDELRSGLRPQALRRVQAALTLRRLAEAEKIAVTEEEVEQEANGVLHQFRSVREVREKVDLEALKDVARGAIRNRKVFARLEEISAQNGAAAA